MHHAAHAVAHFAGLRTYRRWRLKTLVKSSPTRRIPRHELGIYLAVSPSLSFTDRRRSAVVSPCDLYVTRPATLDMFRQLLTRPLRVTPMNNTITLITSTVAGQHFCCADSYTHRSAKFRIVFSESQNANPLDAELGPDFNGK